MNRYLSGLMVAALAAAAMFFPAPAFADHRPGNVVVMGGTLSLTSRYALPAQRYLNARKLYVDELNARGGLLGHKVEMRFYDDKSDIRTAITLYEKLIYRGQGRPRPGTLFEPSQRPRRECHRTVQASYHPSGLKSGDLAKRKEIRFRSHAGRKGLSKRSPLPRQADRREADCNHRRGKRFRSTS